MFHIHDEFFDDLHPKEPYKRESKLVIEEYTEEIDRGERPKLYVFFYLPMIYFRINKYFSKLYTKISSAFRAIQVTNRCYLLFK